MPAAKMIVETGVTGVAKTRADLMTVGQALDDVADRAQTSAAKTKAHAEGLKTLSNAALVGGAGLAAGFGLAANAAMGFDKEMSGVAAVANASAGDLDLLRKAAIKAGADTAYSASEAAKAEGELVKAGVSTADVLGGALSGSLSLAAAGQIDLAQAATISAQAMNVFNLEGKDVGHIADVLAAAANKSAADVGQLADALQQGGLVAKQTGLGLEDTAGVLALFADNALSGSDAGTSLKTMLQRLTPQSSEAKAAMADLGISAYDASGQFIGMSAFAQNLQDSLSGLTAEQRNSALGTIFGSDAIRGASIIMDAGAKGVTEYTQAVNDQGAASRMASTQLDNLAGDLDALKGSFETALIAGGSHANGVLREMTQGATGVVNAFAEAPGWLQQSAVGFAGVGGAGLLAAGAIGTMIPKIREVKGALSNISGGQAVALGGVTAALTVGAIVLEQWAAKKQEAKQRTEEFVNALNADGGAIGANTREHLKNTLVKKGQLDDLGRLDSKMSSHRAAIDVLTAAVGGNVDAQKEFRRAMIASGEVRVTGENEAAVKRLSAAFIETGVQADFARGTQVGLVVGNVDLSRSLSDLTGAQKDAQTQLNGAAKAQVTATGVQEELNAATSAYKDLVAGGKASADELARASDRVTKAQAEQDKITTAVTDATKKSTTAQHALGTQVGLTADEIKDQVKALDDLVKGMYSQEDATRAALGSQIDYEEAQVAVTDAQKAYNEAVKEHGKNSPEAQKAQRDLRQAILGVWSAGEQAATKIGEFTAKNQGLGDVATALTTTGGVKKLLDGLKAQRDALAPGNPLRKNLDDYILRLTNDIPENVRTQIELDIKASIDYGKFAPTNRPGGHGAQARASGGTVEAGSPYVVGEVGPEPFFPAVDGRVISHSDAMTALSSGGNTAVLDELRGLRRAISQLGGVRIGTVNAIDSDALIEKLERARRRQERLTV